MTKTMIYRHEGDVPVGGLAYESALPQVPDDERDVLIVVVIDAPPLDIVSPSPYGGRIVHRRYRREAWHDGGPGDVTYLWRRIA